MTRSDRIAIILCLLGVLGAFLVHNKVFEHMAHLEDEMAYVWQAQAISGGNLTLPSPPGEKSFLVPFVVDYDGVRFGKYPLGWPALLAVGIRLGARSLVNPLLAGLGIWLTYLLAKRTFSETVGLLAAGLTVASPFFLMNSGSLLSHPLGLVLSAGFALSWLEAFGSGRRSKPWLPAILAGVWLGLLVITRPVTAVGVALPFAIHGLYLLVSGSRKTRQRLLALCGIVLGIASLQLVWQYIASGDPFTNLYTLWWEYDRIGFGPGYGVLPEGHSIQQGITSTRQTLQRGLSDLFGWGKFFWIFLPFGLVALYQNRKRRLDGVLISLVFPSLVLVYVSYWIGAFLYGPR
jgi:4-amino-4-deoxy-L-arabinose transferase-like glycosyltransferase